MKTKKKTTTKVKRKYKKKKVVKYKTGTHNSPKCIKPFCYRSGYELTVAEILDNNPDVLCYAYEAIGIPYRSSNIKSTKIRRYFPDFFVTFTDGKRLIIEVKRDDMISNKWTQAKAKACEEWAKKSGIEFQIWGSKEIAKAQLEVLNKQIQLKKEELKK